MENIEKSVKSESRRDFLIKLSLGGTGIMVGMALESCNPMRRAMFNNLENVVAGANFNTENKIGPMAWLEITKDNQIILHSPKVEMGQGAFTGLAQLVAEELEVHLNQVTVVHATTAGRPIDPRSTGGSDSISGHWNTLRMISAKMRVMLLNNASKLLNVPVGSLRIENGIIKSDSGQITFGEIVEQSTEWIEPNDKDIILKEKKDFKVIGQALPRVDLDLKIKGDPIYGIDMQFPDMLYGLVIRPPKIDTQFVSADTSVAVSMPGVVKIVQEENFIGVLAKSRPEAEMAARAVKIEWKTNKIWNQKDIDEIIKVGNSKSYLIQKEGKVPDGELIEENYSTCAGAHAQLEPNGTVIKVEKDKATVYISTQVPKYTRIEIAEVLGMKEEQVEVIPTYLGGGFGRRLHTPNGIQAALMAKAVGQPVHVFFSRQDEFQTAKLRPPTKNLLKAKLTKDGRIDYLEHHISSGTAAYRSSPIMAPAMETMIGSDIGTWGGGRNGYFKIPNYQVYSWKADLPFDTAMWRAPGLMANTFVMESFIDELAHKAGKDPLQFRIDHIADTEKGRRQKRVLNEAAKKAGWGKTLPAGRALGIAWSGELGTVVAQVAEVSIENNEIKVHKVTCAIDPVLAVNPDGIRAQVEGAIIMGLSACMYEKVEVVDSKIEPTIFGPYRMAMMKDAPKDIDVIILESGDRPSGVGEPPIGPIGAAIGNAVFALTGKRLRNLPLNEEFQKISS